MVNGSTTRWPPPGMEAYCTFVLDGEYETFEWVEMPGDLEAAGAGDDGVSSADDSASFDDAEAEDVPEETKSAGDQFTESLGASPGKDGPIEKVINKAVDKLVKQNGIDPSTGFPIAPTVTAAPTEGITMGATAGKPKGNLSAKELSATQSAYVQYAREVTDSGSTMCYLKVSGSNRFNWQVLDMTYDGNVNYNTALGLHIKWNDNHIMRFEASRGGNMGYGATGGGFENEFGQDSTTISVGLEVNFR